MAQSGPPDPRQRPARPKTAHKGRGILSPPRPAPHPSLVGQGEAGVVARGLDHHLALRTERAEAHHGARAVTHPPLGGFLAAPGRQGRAVSLHKRLPRTRGAQLTVIFLRFRAAGPLKECVQSQVGLRAGSTGAAGGQAVGKRASVQWRVWGPAVPAGRSMPCEIALLPGFGRAHFTAHARYQSTIGCGSLIRGVGPQRVHCLQNCHVGTPLLVVPALAGCPVNHPRVGYSPVTGSSCLCCA